MFLTFFNVLFMIFVDFHDFRQILEDLVNFGCQNQVPRGILLRMDGFSGPYEAWRPWRGVPDREQPSEPGPATRVS